MILLHVVCCMDETWEKRERRSKSAKDSICYHPRIHLHAVDRISSSFDLVRSIFIMSNLIIRIFVPIFYHVWFSHVDPLDLNLLIIY